MKRRLLCILLIVALLVTVIAISASATGSASANEQEIYTYLTGTMGLNSAAACGIMANIYYETGFTADISVGTYYGLFMYYAPLASELMTWCGNNGYDYTTVDGQMNFFRYKMESTYQSLYSTLQGISNTGEGAYSAADVFCRQFEKPANASYEAAKRGNYAMDNLFPKYSSGSSATTGGTSSSGSASQPVDSYTGYVTASVLNVRSAAGTGNGIVGTLVRGASVTVVAEGSDSSGSAWCQLSSGGWVSKAYLSAEPVSSGSAGSGSSGGTTYVVTASVLNLRSGAGTGNSVIGSLVYGTAVSVVAEDQDSEGGTWCQLSSGGWVSKTYLSSSAAAGDSGDGSSYTVTASALNVRNGAGTENSVISCLWKGTAVTIVATDYDAGGVQWGQLVSGGWVSMEYVA